LFLYRFFEQIVLFDKSEIEISIKLIKSSRLMRSLATLFATARL
jgi:hypothetical protein